jgi:hypothetical protein
MPTFFDLSVVTGKRCAGIPRKSKLYAIIPFLGIPTHLLPVAADRSKKNDIQVISRK